MNRVTLTGRLTKDPEVMKTQTGLSVLSFTIAVKNTHKADSDADFIQCQAWRQSADYLGKYARKGTMIGLDGSIQTRSYMKDDAKVYVTEVVADRVEIFAQKTKEAESEANFNRMDNQSSESDSSTNDILSQYYGESDELPF